MLDVARRQLRDDCHTSLVAQPGLAARLARHRIAVIGGTGFVGSWLAELVAALNDDFGADLCLHLLGRSASLWHESREHLRRDDITLQTADVRSPFELPRDTTLVLFAAGIADPRIHASDPHRVFATTVYGLDHSLHATARLERIQRFVNLSSGLVLGTDLPRRSLSETDLGRIDFTRFHNLYAEARRAAEGLACVFASQYRIPVSTARAFTFLGPYQPIDAPWAVNNFMRDALSGNDIRIHGDGATRRSYLYGSDVATWLLRIMVDGRDGDVYNVGGDEPVTHADGATLVAARVNPRPAVIYKSLPAASARHHDFWPDISHGRDVLELRPAFDVASAIGRSMRWQAHAQGLERRLQPGI